MLTQRLIPSLLIKGGRLVKGVRFGDHQDAGLPHTTARAHNAQGADELCVLDIEASREGRGLDLETVRKVAAECFMPLTVGGGIGSLDIAYECMASGADKLCLTTTALDGPGLITELATVFGSQSVVLGIDAVEGDGGYRLFDHRAHDFLDRDPVVWAREAVERGAGEIRLMAVDREGGRQGMDLALLEMLKEAVGVPVVLEGGAGTLDHLKAAYAAGADGICVGTMLVFSDNNLVKIKRYLAGRGSNIRQ